MLQTNGEASLPPFFVGKQITGDRIDRFIATKYPLLSGAIGKPDTKAIWYSKEHVEQWLSEMEKAGADGMRVYFGSQGETEDYPNQLCLLMVLTRAEADNGGHSDFTIEDEPIFEARAIKTAEPQVIKRDFNTGSPCPPVCPPGMQFGK